MTSARLPRVAAAVLVALVLAVAPGCGRNHAGTVLAPTGIRPAPATWSGGITGLVAFDPLNAPDLGTPPFPPTRVELYDAASTLVAAESLAAGSNRFTFTGVRPGQGYRVRATSAAFFEGSVGGLTVREDVREAGNVTLRINPAVFSNGMEIIGTIPGCTLADLFDYMFPVDVSGLSTPVLGYWTLPGEINPDGLTIPAGTYRFKFATEFPATLAGMLGWGDALGGTLTAPVTNHPAVLASGTATDIVMTFPTDGVYAFTLDERRRTFSVTHVPVPGGALPARATRR